MKSEQLFSVDGYGVVVTGGASGLGLGFSEALAENGARVTILDVDAERVRAEVARLCALGLTVRGEVLDVRDHSALDAGQRLVRQHQRTQFVLPHDVTAGLRIAAEQPDEQVGRPPEQPDDGREQPGQHRQRPGPGQRDLLAALQA